LKEVACEWWFVNPATSTQKPDADANADKKKEIEFFKEWPLSGTLLSG
jgi:hypothetical protein